MSVPSAQDSCSDQDRSGCYHSKAASIDHKVGAEHEGIQDGDPRPRQLIADAAQQQAAQKRQGISFLFCVRHATSSSLFDRSNRFPARIMFCFPRRSPHGAPGFMLLSLTDRQASAQKSRPKKIIACAVVVVNPFRGFIRQFSFYDYNAYMSDVQFFRQNLYSIT